jgi:hypothetical protein
MPNLAIISLHEKGFWQADLYLDASHLRGDEMEQMGLAPDGFRTFKRDGTEREAVEWVVNNWKDTEIRIATFANPDDDDEL